MKRGTKAPQAPLIPPTSERGFIRARTIAIDDFPLTPPARCGEAGGKMRLKAGRRTS
ncbi:MAG: hypothetical protein H6720_15370 [Sandaracinus sp.]|nr:hypothetical protein [Sandaracinus sp.]